MSDFATRNGGRRCLPRLRTFMPLTGFLLPIMAAWAAGATQTALAADGWFNNARVDLVFANANGERRIRTNPRPQNAEGANFGCTGSTLILGFSSANDNDDDGLAGIWDIATTAQALGASVDMYLDEVSSGNSVQCYVNRLQMSVSAQTPTNPPNPTPPTDPTPPNPAPPTRDYYGALAVSSPNAPGAFVYAYSTDASSIADAERIADNACEARVSAGDFCTIRRRFVTGECLVVYAANNGFYLIWNTGPRNRLSQLTQQGLNTCRGDGYADCRAVISDCNSGTASIAPQKPQFQSIRMLKR